MRKVIVAALALFPILLHAQANTPANTQSNGNASSLQAELGRPKAFTAAADATHSSMPGTTQRVSSGVVAPKLAHTVAIQADDRLILTGIRRTIVVGMTIDKNGVPSDLKVLRSSGGALDQNVLQAVSQYRFRPGTLDNQPVSFPFSLELVVQGPR
jgi:TonB family protein